MKTEYAKSGWVPPTRWQAFMLGGALNMFFVVLVALVAS